MVEMASRSEIGTGQEEEEEERSVEGEDGEEPSPLLSKQTLDELGTLEDADDPDNYKLHSSWAFWYDR